MSGIKKVWTNFSGDVTFSPELYFEPTHTSTSDPYGGLKELVDIVNSASLAHKPLRAIGSGWAYEDIAQSDYWMVSLNQLKRRLHHVIPAALTDELRQNQLDSSSNTHLVHVEAGVKIIDLIEMLEDAGLAMPTLGGANGQNLAGAISTSTHGGDWNQPPLPDFVRAIHLVTNGGGREFWIERLSESITNDERLKPVLSSSNMTIIRNDLIFDAVLVSLGRFGVIYSFVIEVRRTFRVVEVATNPDLREVFEALKRGMTDTTLFDPLFTLLSAIPPPPGLIEGTGVIRTDKPYFFQLAWASARPREKCWAQRRWITDVREELNPPVPNRTDGAHIAYWLNVAREFGLDFVRGDQSIKQMGDSFELAVNEGRRGPHHLLTSQPREASEDITYKGDFIEVIFDARDERYIQFLESIFDEATRHVQVGYISLRPSRASRGLLSMHNVASSHAISIEVAILKGLPGNQDWMNFLHTAALERGGRPHWGQMNKLNEQQVSALYGKKLQNWCTALRLICDQSSTFSNNFTRQRGLEPINQIETTVTAVFPNPDEIIVFRVGNGANKYTSEVQYSNWTKPIEHIIQPDPGRPTLLGPQKPHRFDQRPTGWTGWHALETKSALPDNFVGSAIEGGKTYVFWIAPDGWVNFKRREQDGKWSQLWWAIGNSHVHERNGVPGGAVHAVSCQPGMLHVFYTDRRGGILAARGDTSTGTKWPESVWIGGRRTTAVKTIPGGHITAVSRRPGQLDAFVSGLDGKIYTAAWNAQDDWRGWWAIEGLSVKPGTYIGAVSRSIDLLDIFVADENGRTMSAAWEPNSGWRGWWHIQGGVTNPGGYVTAISRSTNKLDIFTATTDLRVHTAAWDPGTGWGGWWPITSAKAISSVWPVSRTQDRLDLFFVAPDGQVQTSSWAPDRPWDGPWTIS